MSQLPHTGSSTFGIFDMWDFSFLAVACNLLVSACVHSSLTRDQTQAPCIGSAEYQPLDHQGSPMPGILITPVLSCSNGGSERLSNLLQDSKQGVMRGDGGWVEVDPDPTSQGRLFCV